MIWFVRNNIIQGNFVFARYSMLDECFIVYRLGDRGYMSVCVFHDFDH